MSVTHINTHTLLYVTSNLLYLKLSASRAHSDINNWRFASKPGKINPADKSIRHLACSKESQKWKIDLVVLLSRVCNIQKRKRWYDLQMAHVSYTEKHLHFVIFCRCCSTGEWLNSSTVLEYKIDVKVTHWYKMFPQARRSFPSPEFIFLHGITRYLILFSQSYWRDLKVLILFFNSESVSWAVGLDDGNIIWVNLRCQTCLSPASRQSPRAHVHHCSLQVQGRIPSQLLGRSADAASPHKYTLPRLLSDTAAFH